MNQSAIWKEEKKNRLKASFHFVQYELSQESNLAHTVKQRKKLSHTGCKMWLAFCLWFWNPEEDTKRLVELRAWCFDEKLFMRLSPGSEVRTWKIKADLRHNEYIKRRSGWSGSDSLLEAEWLCLRTSSLQTEAGQGVAHRAIKHLHPLLFCHFSLRLFPSPSATFQVHGQSLLPANWNRGLTAMIESSPATGI